MDEKRVFLSHSSSDKAIATLIAEKLRGVGVWVDFWNLDAGDVLPHNIAEAIHGSKWFILLASNASVNSRWVKYEINNAIIKWIQDRDYKIIVARIDECKIPDELSPFLYINTPRKPSASIAQVFQAVTSQKASTGKITSRRSSVVDRFDEMAAIETATNEGKAFIYLWGLYGIGKTTIVERASEEIYSTELSQFTLTEGYGLLRLSLELAAQARRQLPASKATENDLIASALESIDALIAANKVILFDNFETALTEDGELNPYIYKLFNAFISRGKFESPIFVCSTQLPRLSLEHHRNSQIIKINQLTDRDLLFCLQNWLMLASPDKKRYKREQLELIVPHLHGYPLGAKLASYLIVTHSPESLLNEVRYFTELRIDVTRHLLGRIRTGLSDLQTMCLQALSLVDEGVLLSELADVLKTDIEEVRKAVDKNAEALLIFSQDGLLQTHPLIKDYFWSRAYESGEWKKLTERYAINSGKKLKQSGLSDAEIVRLCAFTYRMLTLCGRYEEAKELGYQFSEQLREACARLYYAKDYELSLKYANAWLAIDSRDKDIRWFGARCLTRLERFKEAEEELKKLQASGYKKDKLFHAWGLLRRDEDRDNEALEYFIKALEEWPNYTPALRDFGDLQEKMGDISGAMETLAKAYALAPRDPFIAPKYADLLTKTGKLVDALRVMEGLIAAYPEEQAFEHRLSVILDDLGRQNDAYEHARKAVQELKSNLPEAILHLASLELQVKNNPKVAEAYLEKLPRRLNKRVERVKDTVLADIKRHSNDIEGAKQILRKYPPSEDPYITHLLVQIEIDECSKLLVKKEYTALKAKLFIIRNTLEQAISKFPYNASLKHDMQFLNTLEPQV